MIWRRGRKRGDMFMWLRARELRGGWCSMYVLRGNTSAFLSVFSLIALLLECLSSWAELDLCGIVYIGTNEERNRAETYLISIEVHRLRLHLWLSRQIIRRFSRGVGIRVFGVGM